MYNKAVAIINEVRKAVVGKDEIIAKILMAILAQGHILLEDCPGVGKTTMVLAFSKALDLSYKRLQFTPEILPGDVVGYTVINRETGKTEYRPGAALCNLFFLQMKSIVQALKRKVLCLKLWRKAVLLLMEQHILYQDLIQL